MKADDIVKLKVDNESLMRGLDYALLSWTSTFNRMGKPNPYSRMQKIMIGVAAEVELQKYLESNRIKYGLKGQTKWYQVDRYDISINNVPIDVKANMLDLNNQYILDKIHDTPIDKWLLKCQALVPLDQFNCKSARKIKKCYVFPFICGRFDPDNGSDPFIHAFWDYRWLKKGDFKKDTTCSNLRLSYTQPSSNASLRIYGTSGDKQACIEDIDLSKANVLTKNKFFQVFSILWTGTSKPVGDLSIKWLHNNLKEKIKADLSFNLEKTKDGYVPTLNNWQSMQMFNYDIYIAGWIHENDMRVDGREYKRFSKEVEQYQEIKVDNWGCDVVDLNPLKNINEL